MIYFRFIKDLLYILQLIYFRFNKDLFKDLPYNLTTVVKHTFMIDFRINKDLFHHRENLFIVIEI